MGIFSRKKGNGGKNEGLWVVGFGVFRERERERESSGSLLDN